MLCFKMDIFCFYFCLLLMSLFAFQPTHAKIYTVELENQERDVIPISTFGYLKGGSLKVNITNLKLFQEKTKNPISAFKKIGLRIDKSSRGGRSDYMEGECPLTTKFQSMTEEQEQLSRAILTFVYENNSTVFLQVCTHNFSGLHVFSSSNTYDSMVAKEPLTSDSDCAVTTARAQRDTSNALPVTYDMNALALSTSFYFHIDNDDQAGLYELYFHNCNNGVPIKSGHIHITERNSDNFLSAGESALPPMYGAMAGLIFLTSLFWIGVLWKNRAKVFAIHYLMAILMITKAWSITFHSIDYHFISQDGKQEAWAVVIFYIVHLLKGILLFICLLLIGTGWAFIKYVLSDREKKLFMIVIPLQVIANVAYMIQEEEQGNKLYDTFIWTEIIVFVDILCFGIILISVVWSVRHLQDASQSDGKAAISLTKLKLFQRFYVMVICYLYFRRVLVYLLKITLPFRFTWIHQFFYEMVSLIFFIVTGYMFRPGCDNPYLSVPQVDEEEVESHALTECGLTETVVKVNQHERDDPGEDEKESLLPKQRNITSTV